MGGVAAAAHGSLRTTQDIDAVYGRTPHNLERLVEALAQYHPYLRGCPPGLPFVLDKQTLNLNSEIEEERCPRGVGALARARRPRRASLNPERHLRTRPNQPGAIGEQGSNFGIQAESWPYFTLTTSLGWIDLMREITGV